MAKLICSFAERVLIGAAGFLLVLALIAGMSQSVLADPVLGPLIPPVNCNKAPGYCQVCACGAVCGVGLPGSGCPTGCNPTGNLCPNCTCKAPAGYSCDCYK